MKKILFTVCSIAIICCFIVASCSKDDYNGTQVGYASQPGYGGGHNPNPNGLPYSTITPTTVITNTTTPTNYGSISINIGGTTTFTTAPSCSSATWTSTGGSNSITLTFNSVPASGTTYTIVNSAPAPGQVNIVYAGSTATSGTVSVSGSTATFDGAVFPAYNVTSGSLTCH